jgi:hypothetical protein
MEPIFSKTKLAEGETVGTIFLSPAPLDLPGQSLQRLLTELDKNVALLQMCKKY